MGSLSPKKLYEKIIISKHQPSDEELASLEGTHWKHRLEGTTVDSSVLYHPSSFKKFFAEEAPVVSTEHQSRRQIADTLVDRVEDKFGLHFAVLGASKVNHEQLDEIKHYIMTHLKRCVTSDGDKRYLVRVVNKADNIHDLMISLNLLTM